MTKITEYLNHIRKQKVLNWGKGEYLDLFTFLGDGEGDFEERAEDVTKEVLEAYAGACQEQIEFAKEYLEILKLREEEN